MNRSYGYAISRPFPMPQSSEPEALQGNARYLQENNMAGARSFPRSPTDQQDYFNFPPNTPRNLEEQRQPDKEGPEFFEAGNRAAQEMGPAAQDVISGSNNANFFTIGLWFTYKLDESRFGIVELAPNGTGAFTVSVSADADFIIYKIQGQVTRDIAINISDAGSNRNFQNREMTALELLGSGFRAYNLDVPILIKARSALQVQLTDLGPLSRDPYTGLFVPDAGLQPSLIAPAGPLVNRVSLSFVGVKRSPRQR